MCLRILDYFYSVCRVLQIPEDFFKSSFAFVIFFFVPIAETLKSSKISEENFCVLMVKETSVTKLDQAAFLSLALNAPCSRSRLT